MDEKLHENMLGLKTTLAMLIGEVSFYSEMLKLSSKKNLTLEGKLREHAVELEHHLDTALKVLSEMKENLRSIVPDAQKLKKNSSSTRGS